MRWQGAGGRRCAGNSFLFRPLSYREQKRIRLVASRNEHVFVAQRALEGGLHLHGAELGDGDIQVLKGLRSGL